MEYGKQVFNQSVAETNFNFSVDAYHETLVDGPKNSFDHFDSLISLLACHFCIKLQRSEQICVRRPCTVGEQLILVDSRYGVQRRVIVYGGQ